MNVEAGKRFDFIIPAQNQFYDPDQDNLSYNIATISGEALPSNLKFDKNSLTLSGVINQEEVLNLQLIATDSKGASASIPLIINVRNANQDVDLKGVLGQDYLQGSSGDGVLKGYLGDDTLIGGRGDDFLSGSLGDDRYIINADDGHDTIEEHGGRDILHLNGLQANQLWFKNEDGALKISALGSNNTIDIYGNIERFELDNGKQLVIADVQRLVQAMSAFQVDNTSSLSASEQMQNHLNQMDLHSFWR